MKAVAVVLYATILVGAASFVDSRLLWILYGPLAVAFLEWRCLRAFVGARPTKELLSGLIGPGAAACVGAGLCLVARKIFKAPVPYDEIARVALTGGLLWYLFEECCAWASRRVHASGLQGWRKQFASAGAVAAVVGPLAFVLAPLVNLHPPRVAPVDLRKHFPARFEPVEFRTADGVRLSGWWAATPSPKGNVVLFHGHGQNRSQCALFLSYLQSRGYNVLAFDFRGHGASAGLSATFGAREIPDVQAAVAFVQERAPAAPLYLCGVSYGAIVSLQALPKLPAVAAVWVDSPCGNFAAIANRYFDYFPGPVRAAVVGLFDAVTWCDCGFTLTGVSPNAALADVRVPIHVSHCRGDPLIPYDDCRAMFDAYRGPKVGDWPDIDGHGVFGHVEPTDYLDRMANFFAAHPQPASVEVQTAGLR